MKQKELYVYSFYRFTAIQNKLSFKESLDKFFNNKSMRGTILIADEGINASISGNIYNLSETIKLIKKELGIRKLNLKINKNSFLPFNRMKVRLKKEIVSLGKGKIDVIKYKAKSVNPNDWDNLILDKNTKIIDVRNQFEIDIGKFNNSLNPKTNNFREFPESINKLKINKNDKIAMYCTGGIRCEKASAFLKKDGYKNIVQLDGGIINYLNYKRKSKTKSIWNGECFVFDDRVTVNKELKKGKYIQCYGCGRPIPSNMAKSRNYIEGVQCELCYKTRTKKQKKSSSTRQEQIIKARSLSLNYPQKKIMLFELKHSQSDKK